MPHSGNSRLTHLLLTFSLLALGLSFTPIAQVTAQSSDFKLTLLHTSENHGHWEPFAPAQNQPTVGGIARRATLIKQIKAEGGNFLVLDSGDISQGSLLFTKYQGQEGRDLYNAVGYDAVALGNHEFDFGAKTLLDRFVTGAKFDILAANTDYTVEPGLNGKIKPYVIKEVGGQKIGLIGVMHEHLAQSVSPTFGVSSSDPYAAVQKAVGDLQAQGVNKIIVLSHMGYNLAKGGRGFDDLGLAAAVDGVDVIISGHTDTVLGDPDKLPKFVGKPDGPYPTVVKSSSGHPVLVVHAFNWGKFLGRLNVTFDANGVPKSWDGGNIVVDDKIAEDLSVANLYTGLSAALDEVRRQIVGKAALDLPGERADVRSKEAALGNLIADSVLAVTTADRTQIVMLNGGAIRTTLKAGDLSYGDILTVLPFGNTIMDLNLKGSEVIAALENGVSGVNLADPNSSAGRFPQVAGLRFVVDFAKPPGSRIQMVEVGAAKSGYASLDVNASYRVATTDFQASGGDGYTMFTRGTDLRKTDILLPDAVADYLKAHGTVNPAVEGRITLAGRQRSVTQPTAAIPATATLAATPSQTLVAPATSTPLAPLPTTGGDSNPGGPAFGVAGICALLVAIGWRVRKSRIA